MEVRVHQPPNVPPWMLAVSALYVHVLQTSSSPMIIDAQRVSKMLNFHLNQSRIKPSIHFSLIVK